MFSFLTKTVKKYSIRQFETLLQNKGKNITKILQKLLTFFIKYNILSYEKKQKEKMGGVNFGNR